MEGPGFSIAWGEALAEIIAIITVHLHQVIDRQCAHGDWDGGYIGHLGEDALILGGEEAGIGGIGELTEGSSGPCGNAGYKPAPDGYPTSQSGLVRL